MRLLKFSYCSMIILCLSLRTLAHSEVEKMHPAKDAPISFIENKGQWTSEAKYKAEVPGGVMFLTEHGFVYAFTSAKDEEQLHEASCGNKGGDPDALLINHHAYKVNFIGALSGSSFKTYQKRKEYHNYFIGNNKTAWASHVGLFGMVEQKNVYNGIDLKVYSGATGNVKYDFHVKKGVDPATIVLGFEGVVPQITASGDLLLKTSVNEITEKAPVSYQLIEGKRIAVLSKYKITDGQLSFIFPDGYNKDYDLVIDPDLVFATYSGAKSGTHYAYSTTYDAEGNMYAAGLSTVKGWPVTVGAFQSAGLKGSSVAINKYDASGSDLIYSTYYGGSGTYDIPNTIRVNKANELYVAGATNSIDLPTTTGAFDTTINGSADIFVAHFNTDGTNLLGATYVGGSGMEPYILDLHTSSTPLKNANLNTSPIEINFDAKGNPWIVSVSNSANFPVTNSAFQGALAGGYDGVLFQLDPTCSNLMYSTFLGGSSDDIIYNIEFTSTGEIVICGGTKSSNFPSTPGVLHTTYQGGIWDGFLCKFNPTGTTLLHSTFLGTAGIDNATKIQIDCADNIYVLGRTFGNYPITSGAWSMAKGDVYVDKINPDFTRSLSSTRIGKTQGTPAASFLPTAFLLDICGQIYVAGMSATYGQLLPAELPVTADAFSNTPKHFWFCVLEANFTDLHFGSFFGSGKNDHAHVGTSRFDPKGIVYHSVCSTSQTFPTTNGSWSQKKLNGSSNDNVSFKFNFDAINIDLKEISTQGAMDSRAHCVRGCKSAFIDFTRQGDLTLPMTIRYIINGTATNGTDYEKIADSIVIPAQMSLATLEIKPLLVPNSSGTKEVVIQAISPCGCENGKDNIVKEARIKIYDSLYVDFITPADTLCPNTEITIEAEIDSTLNYKWLPAALDQGTLSLKTTVYSTSVYSITATQPGAPATCPPHTIFYEAVVEPIPQISFDKDKIIVCLNKEDSLSLTAYVTPENIPYNYKWSTADYLRDDHSLNNKFAAPPGTYYKTLTVSSPVAGCSNKDSLSIEVKDPPILTMTQSRDTTIHYGDTLRLNTESKATKWVWSPTTYLDNPNGKNPLARPLETTRYTVVAMDAFGCSDTTQILIHVDFSSKVFIPNAFSPNGDGINDMFKMDNDEYEKILEFKIYNRLGQLVFNATDKTRGWDGTIDGKPATSDTYFYIIRLNFPGGIEKAYRGDVALIR